MALQSQVAALKPHSDPVPTICLIICTYPNMVIYSYISVFRWWSPSTAGQLPVAPATWQGWGVSAWHPAGGGAGYPTGVGCVAATAAVTPTKVIHLMGSYEQ